MERQGPEVHLSPDEARAGSTPHIVRYVLGISLVLAILALSAIWMTGATVSPGHAPDDATAYLQGSSGQAPAQTARGGPL